MPRIINLVAVIKEARYPQICRTLTDGFKAKYGDTRVLFQHSGACGRRMEFEVSLGYVGGSRLTPQEVKWGVCYKGT